MSDMAAMTSSSIAAGTKPVAPARPEDPRLWKVAQEFQEIFLGQVVKAMRSSTKQDDDFFQEYAGRDTFDQMFSEAIGKQMAQDRAIGMREAIYRQMGGRFVAEAYNAGSLNPATGAPGMTPAKPLM